MLHTCLKQMKGQPEKSRQPAIWFDSTHHTHQYIYIYIQIHTTAAQINSLFQSAENFGPEALATDIHSDSDIAGMLSFGPQHAIAAIIHSKPFNCIKKAFFLVILHA